MTYIDEFGMERHTPHCGCPKCMCRYGWPDTDRSHECVRQNGHVGRHTCKCGHSRTNE